MKKIYLILLIASCSFNTEAQSLTLKKADKSYNQLAYKNASELYTSLLGTSKENPSMLEHLAMSYYRLGEMKKAADVFTKFVKESESSSDNIFYYCQALKQSGNYTESDKWMAVLHKKFPVDTRGKEYDQHTNYLEQIKAKGERYDVKNLDINTPYSDFGGYAFTNSERAFMSAENSTLWRKIEWTWNGTRYLDIFTTKEENNQFKQAKPLSKLNSKYHEGPLCFNGNNIVYFTASNQGKLKYDKKGIQHFSMFIATIDKSGNYTTEMVPFCSSEYSVGHPTISNDGKTLYFASNMPGSKGVDIYTAEILEGGKLGAPKLLEGVVNTEGDEMFPFMDSKGNLFFASNGHIGLGGLDVFILKNGSISNLGQPINSNLDDFGFIMKADGKTGYFSSNRSGGKGSDDIYSFLYTGPSNIMIKGNVTDKTTGLPIANATIQVLDQASNKMINLTTDSEGNYTTSVNVDSKFNMKANATNYSEDQQNISVNEDDVTVNFALTPEAIKLVYHVKDKKLNTPIENVALQVSIVKTNVAENLKTDVNGSVTEPLKNVKKGEKITLKITLSKDGYLSKTVTKDIDIKSNEINISELMDLTLSPIAVGADLNDLIAINPIYFDLGKSDIRPDAAVELDKIVAVMNEYPNMVIELGSHTDCRSSKSFNQQLSDKRAKSSAAYIQKKIKNPIRIKGVGYGESRLKVDCPCEGNVKSNCSEEEHQKNRRTEFIIKKFN